MKTLLFSRSSRGFTLIELMVAIAIVAVLSTVGLIVYSNGQRLARDSKRKADLKQIENSLALYYSDHNRFPMTPANDTAVVSTSGSNPWLADTPSAAFNQWAFNQEYIETLPQDPINNTTFRYSYQSSNDGFGTCTAGRFYLLYAQLENTTDADLFGAAPYSICGQTIASLSWANGTYLLVQQ